MNHSVNSSSTMELDCIMLPTCIATLLLVPAINIYVLLLIVRGTVETITSEFYCLNLAVSEILTCFFCLFNIIGQYLQVFLKAATFFAGFLDISRPLFQGCICVERYMAVIHPVTFFKYKLLGYKKIICSVCWSITLGYCVAFGLYKENLTRFVHVLLGFYIVILCIMLWCCVSVMLALKQPGPGEGKTQSRGTNAKRRAFNIIMSITVFMVIDYVPYNVLLTLYGYIGSDIFNVLLSIILSFNSFYGLVHPLLYIRRTAKLPSFLVDSRFIIK